MPRKKKGTPRTHTKVKPKRLGRPRKNIAKAAKEKGKEGEREAARLWCKHGYDAERGVQVTGAKGASDINIRGLDDYFHVEVKRVEQFQLYPSLAQATRDAKTPFKIPLVMHRRSGQKFVVVLDAEHFIGLVKKAGFTPPLVEEEI